MICSEFCELLDSYESLTDEQRTEMENHAAECETCRNELEFFKSVISNLSSIPSPKAPASLIDNVNAKLDAEKPVVIGFKWNFRVLSTVAACLAIGLAVGINNGYIKKNIEKQDTSGVIKETVVTTETTDVSDETETPDLPQATPVPVAEAPATESEVEGPVETEKVEKPAVNPVKPAQEAKPAKEVKPAPASVKPSVTPQPIQNTPEKVEVVEETAPVETNVAKPPVASAPTTDDTSDVEDYQIKEDGPQIAYGRYNVEPNRRTPSAISDYLHVGSNDMGTVVSTMSEMGVKNSGGYYMTSRQNFYALMDTLNDKGVGYECDLQYNSGENISFRLTYN